MNTKSLFCSKTFYVVFSFLLFCLFVFFTASPTAFADDAIGQIVWVKGKVEAVDTNNKTRLLQRRSPIFVSDTIMTGTGSGQIIFTDNSLVALREGTTFKIDQYKFNATSPSENKYVAGVAKGGFRTITGLISKSNPDGYEVHTPVATIGVRGTVYSIFYSTAKGLAVKLDGGALFVTNKAGKVELNKARNLVYSQTSGLNVKPVITSTPAPEFKTQPAIISSTQSSTNSDGSSTTGSGSNNVTAGPSKSLPKGGKVDEFCIN